MSDADPRPDDSQYPWSADSSLWTRDFARVLLANFILFTAFQMLVPVLPLYTGTFTDSEAQVGVVVGALTFTVILVRPFAGWWVDRISKRKLLMGSIIVFGVAGLAYPLAASVIALVSIRIVQGFGWSAVNPAVSTMVLEIPSEKRRGEALAYQSTSQSLAMAVGPAAGLILSQTVNFSLAFVASVVLSFLALVLTRGFEDRSLPYELDTEFRFSDLVERTAVIPSALTMLTTFIFGGLTTFVPLDALDRELGNPAVFFVTFATILVVLRPITGRLSDNLNQSGLLLFPGLALIGTSLLVLAFTEAWWTLAATGLLWALGFGITQPLLRVLAVARAPRDHWGRANATMATAYEAGLGSGAFLLGFLASLVGIPNMFALLSSVALLAILFLVITGLHRR